MAYSHIKKILTGQSEATPEERAAAAATTLRAGMLVALNSSNQFIAHSVAQGPILPMVVLPNSSHANVDVYATATQFAVGDRVKAAVPQRGDKASLWLTVSQTIVVGDYLESAGDGRVQKYAADAATPVDDSKIIGIALEAVTTDGSTTSPIAVMIR